MLAGAALLFAKPSRAQASHDLTPFLIADRAAEVALARSSAPKNVSDSATVFVLTRSGFVEAAHGTNGFTCLVLRSFSGSLSDPAFWSSSVRAPNCLNSPASRTVLPEMRKRAEWIMAGVSTSEIAERTKRAYASHELPLPAEGAMTYMLSPNQVLGENNAHWMPHLMFFYSIKSAPPSLFGAGGMTSPVIDGSQGDPTSPVLTLLIPVRQWSDGTPALGQ
jgi:hypothetical protein